MNFLAHIYLSGNDPQVILGNYMADSVKGNSFKNYTEGIQKGILLHRFIDSFTDSHLVVSESKKRLRQNYSKYAGVITDIFYDHFLAKNWHQHSDLKLNQYASNAYELLSQHNHLLPFRSQQFLTYAIKYDILTNYANMEGIKKVFIGMSRRSTFVSNMENAPVELNKYYIEFENEFNLFFPELKSQSHAFLNSI